MKKGHAIGGASFKILKEAKLAELSFFAMGSGYKGKGYGSILMKHLKEFLLEENHVKKIVTYADNLAIGKHL